MTLFCCLESLCPAYSQTYSDCTEALEICSKESLRFDFNRDSTTYSYKTVDCLSIDYPTTWLRWEIASAGYLVFTITPETYAEDIDFALYRLDSINGCADKELVRCMLSGMNHNNVQSSLPCLGPTGLSRKLKGRTERAEEGCPEGSSSFLPAITCKPGEIYALAIQNFDNAGGGFFIDFCGDAHLVCDTVQCAEFSGAGRFKKERELLIFNELQYHDSLAFSLYASSIELAEVLIKGEEGATVYRGQVQLAFNTSKYAVPIQQLPTGQYSLEVKMRSRKASGVFNRIAQPPLRP